MMDFRELGVWRKAHAFTLRIYRVTLAFPREEKYGLTSQLRSSAASVPANIAEGCGRDTKADLRRFLSIAAGSISEAEYWLLLARDLSYLDDAVHAELALEASAIKKALNGYMHRIKQDPSPKRQQDAQNQKIKKSKNQKIRSPVGRGTRRRHEPDPPLRHRPQGTPPAPP